MASENGSSTPQIAVPMFTRDPRLRGQQQAGHGLDPFSEIGTTGLKQFGGFVLEEWLSQLSGKRGAWAYRELMDNSPVLGGIMFAIRMLARQVDWRVEQEKAQRMPNGMSSPDFAESCMHDMSHSWGDFVSEALSMIGYGWSFHEECFKRREGPKVEGDIGTPETEEDDSPATSQFSDGLIGWRKLPVRAQETLLRWEFSGYSTPRAMEQTDWHGGTHLIPMEKALLFRTQAARDNPEGASFFRPAWTSYFAIKNIQQIESIGIERDLAGLPMLTPPEGVDLFTVQNKAKLQAAEELVQSVRKDEAMGIVLPSAGWKFELVRAPGSRQIDTNEVIKRHRQEMAAAVLADFLLVGLDGLGSYAMVDVKSDLFGLAVDAVLDIICEVFNRFGFPRLFALNGVKLETPLKLNHSSAGRLDLERVGEFLYKLAGAGAPIPWSNELIEQLFNEAGLPANFKGETTVNVHKTEQRPLTKAEAHKGAMVALYPPHELANEIAQPGGESARALHLTLSYLGDASDLEDPQRLEDVVRGWAAATPPIAGLVSGHGHFDSGPEPVTYASIDAPALPAAREALVEQLCGAGMPHHQEHGFTPHMTLAYSHVDPHLAVSPVTFDHAALSLGGDVKRFPLRGVHKAQDGEIDVTGPLGDRARVLSIQLEGEVADALKDLGEQAASAYLRHGVQKDARSVVAKVLGSLNIKSWVQRRLVPIMRNAGARTAADTQRLLRDLIDKEVQVDAAAVEKAAGVDLEASDIEPQVREAIEKAIGEGAARGEHPTRVAQRIREMVPPGRFTKAGSKYRANLIARDQTLRAQRAATLSAYESMPNIESVRVVDGVFGPPRSDETCIERSGETVALADAAAQAPELHPMCTVSYNPIVTPA